MQGPARVLEHTQELAQIDPTAFGLLGQAQALSHTAVSFLNNVGEMVGGKNFVEGQNIILQKLASDPRAQGVDKRLFEGVFNPNVPKLQAVKNIIADGCEKARRLAAETGFGDAVVVNTCAVTAEAVRQARQAIRRARRERPDDALRYDPTRTSLTGTVRTRGASGGPSTSSPQSISGRRTRIQSRSRRWRAGGRWWSHR